jgi:hypothetical protein
MTVSLLTNPRDSYAQEGKNHSFAVGANGVSLTYQWFVDGARYEGATNSTFTSLVAGTDNNYSRVYVSITDTDDGSVLTSATVFALTTAIPSPYADLSRTALLWNYNNDTFTWKDTGVEQQVDGKNALLESDYQFYGFTPGYQERWEDYKELAYNESTWADETKRWSETFSKSTQKEMLIVSNYQAFKGEQQRNSVNSLKKYFVERTQIDFDGLSQNFRSGKVKQTKRFVIDAQADQRQIARGSESSIKFYVGWSFNLMEDPKYSNPIVFNLQARDFGGSYKVDYRSSGRYMGIYFDLTNASQLSLTGGEVDVSQTSGR